jgi:hypothetical protein
MKLYELKVRFFGLFERLTIYQNIQCDQLYWRAPLYFKKNVTHNVSFGFRTGLTKWFVG